MADDDMPDLDLLGGALPPRDDMGAPISAAATAAAEVPPAEEAMLNEEDELELALEAELDAEAEQQRQQLQQQQQPPPSAQQQLQAAMLAPPLVPGSVLQDAAQAGAAAAAALQQEEDEALPLTEDGFIDLDRLTAKQHQRYNTLVNDMLTEQQLDRYSAFRRSNLRRPIQFLMSKTLGGAPNPKALIALSSVTKSFVDDLVAAAIGVADERGETTPLQPAHIHEAYRRLIEQEKVPGKTARRHASL